MCPQMDCLQEDLIVITDSATKFERDLLLKIDELNGASEEKESLLSQLNAVQNKVVRMEKEFQDSVVSYASALILILIQVVT